MINRGARCSLFPGDDEFGVGHFSHYCADLLAENDASSQTPVAVSDLVTVGFFGMRPHENGHLLAMSFYTFDQVSKGLVVSLRKAVRNKRWFDEVRVDLDDVRSAVKLSAQRATGFSVCRKPLQ